jgi:hypothetical protein
LPEAAPIYEDGRLKVYQSPPKLDTVTYLTLGNGWSDPAPTESGGVMRTLVGNIENQAELFLHHPEGRSLFLQITAASEVPQQLTIFANDEPVSKIQVNKKFTPSTIRLPWQAGHIVKLKFLSDNPPNSVSVSRIGLAGIQD